MISSVSQLFGGIEWSLLPVNFVMVSSDQRNFIYLINDVWNGTTILRSKTVFYAINFFIPKANTQLYIKGSNILDKQGNTVVGR